MTSISTPLKPKSLAASIASLPRAEIEALIDSAVELKAGRSLDGEKPLQGETWAMISAFERSSIPKKCFIFSSVGVA